MPPVIGGVRLLSSVPRRPTRPAPGDQQPPPTPTQTTNPRRAATRRHARHPAPRAVSGDHAGPGQARGAAAPLPARPRPLATPADELTRIQPWPIALEAVGA